MSRAADNCQVIYSIDASDRLVFINEGWAEFASHNDGRTLQKTGLIGSSIWQHVTGRTLRFLLKSLFQTVRDKGVPVAVPFRCDSAVVRRFMEMRISPMPDGAIQFCCTELRTETRPRIALLDRVHGSGERQVLMCGWCNRVAVPDWQELDEAVQNGALLAVDETTSVSHGICDQCAELLAKEIESA